MQEHGIYFNNEVHHNVSRFTLKPDDEGKMNHVNRPFASISIIQWRLISPNEMMAVPIEVDYRIDDQDWIFFVVHEIPEEGMTIDMIVIGA